MIQEKYDRLKSMLGGMQSVVIAYSGGVDSTLLSKVAKDVLGNRAVAVTAQSETYVKSEYEQAVQIAGEIGIRHEVIQTSELNYPNYSSNPINRCYYCKRELFSEMLDFAKQQKIQYVLDGSNADDGSDYRPGIKAVRELEIRSPLKEVGLTKREVRALSKQLGLPNWNKPAVACLGSRFPYGTEITHLKLRMLEKAESFLHRLGIQQCRVRHHEKMARIEVLPDDIPLLLSSNSRRKIIDAFKKIGYQYISVDLEGYRSGSMNETLSKDEMEQYEIENA